METPSSLGIPFVASNSQQSFRLLELPPELLELINSERPTLTLKSASPGPSPPGGNTSQPHAVLCTENKTFEVRQVQSSNSIYLLSPTSYASPPRETLTDSALSIVGTSQATLELVPVTLSAIPFLTQAIPTYSGAADGDGDLENMSGGSNLSKLEVKADVPFSDAEFAIAWKHIVAFELDGAAMKPTPVALYAAWKAILCAATSEGIKLQNGFSLPQLLTVMEEDEQPQPLVEAIITRVSTDAVTARLDKSKSIPWIGILILKLHQQLNSSLSVNQFLQEWKDQVLSEWVQDISLDKIQGLFTCPTPQTIKFNDNNVDSIEGKNTTKSKSSNPKAGKWHEKFRHTTNR
ncbi:MAG: hypothetical protein M1829_004742 [Trizodia sp. TS-e1964]|nr:MAG: hypothetical protein M1829_004742 [Trizodia sp. TS-e1964]